MTAKSAFDPRLLDEAADWALAFRFDAPDAARQAEFELWRNRSPDHARAWDKAEAVFRSFDKVPPAVGRAVLDRAPASASRRATLRNLGVAGIAAPAGIWAWRAEPWRYWLADLRSATGEIRAVALPDASALVLNTASAVDVSFDATARRLELIDGEILVTTHADPAASPRPFTVATPQGVVEALGTRFSLRRTEEGSIRVAVFEHAVRIHPARGPAQILQAGEQAEFRADRVGAVAPVEDEAAMWQHGMLIARDMRLARVVAELARYRRGILRCDPAVAERRVSGAISLTDTDSALDLIAQSLGLHILRRTPYWVSVTAAG